MRPPEVVLLAAANDPLGGDPDVPPDPDRLVVGSEHGHPQPIGLDPVDLGDELVAPPAGLGLEVVAEREVPEHLEQGQVARGVSDEVDVDRAEDLLDGYGTGERRLGVAEEVGDELVHAGVRQQQAGLGRRDQRRGRDALVPALLEEA